MRTDAINLEEARLEGISGLDQYPSYHERHRIFPAVFEERKHARIIDLAAGVGVVAKRIHDGYKAEILCNDISPTARESLAALGLATTSFDLDDDQARFPFPEKSFDAVIALATIEHIIHIDHFLEEIRRILSDNGFLYLSAPNYSGLPYLIPFLLTGRTFHNPLQEPSRYEFYAHVRYFTYRTMLEFVQSFGFTADTVYLPLPQDSSRFKAFRQRAPLRASAIWALMRVIYSLSPRWASEPVICFRKGGANETARIRKAIL